MDAVIAENKEEIGFWKFLQYYFFKQWKELRAYANENGVSIIGDLPIYVALDSADVWANPQMFQLDENLEPTFVAGCPPDGFSATGQLWGNPLFRWDKMEEDNFSWWIKRITYACNTYNMLRLDHFRGFEAYYAIPYGDEDASGGHWEQGPGIKLFEALEQSAGRQNIIAEDLGFLTEPVKELLAKSGFPGMKVLELAFDSRDENSVEYLPHNITNNYVAYVGTHDNDTIQGWFTSAAPEDVRYAQEYLSMPSLMQGH
jgi:4-alpha-glucanotransferase